MAIDLELIELVISSDNLEALGRVNPSGDLQSFSESKLLSKLASQSIEVTEEVRQRISQLGEAVRLGQLPNEDYLLVQGRPAEPGQDGTVTWDPACNPEEVARQADSPNVDHYARSTIISVSAGQSLCVITPPTDGQPGRDIFGRDIASRKGRKAPASFSDGIAASDADPNLMVAKISGRLNYSGHRAWIAPLLVVSRNVDFQTGNINFDGDVLIQGHVLDLFQVKCSRDLVIKGLIEGAQINCGGSLVCGGGIAGKEKAVINVGGTIRARFIDNATVTAGSTIMAQKEVVNSKIATKGKLITPGAITACTVEAYEGIEATVVGSQSGIRTSLVVGYNRDTMRQLTHAEREIGELEDFLRENKAKLDSLVKRRNALPESQQSRMLQLQNNVRRDETRVATLKTERDALQEIVKANRDASIKVNRIIHESTTVQVGKAVLTLKNALKGPMRLFVHKVDGIDHIAAGSDQRGFVVLDAT